MPSREQVNEVVAIAGSLNLLSSLLIALVVVKIRRRSLCLKRKRDEGARVNGGSRPGKRANCEIGREEGAEKINKDYFCRMPQHGDMSPTFDESQFERIYRMPREVYEHLRDGLLRWSDPYFKQRRDCCGKLGASTDQKFCSAMRQLAYGTGADALVELVGLAESTNLLTLKMFAEGVVVTFEAEWLRLPNEEEIRRIEKEYANLGFPGCLGCVDCASWSWEMSPIGWQGMYKGKDSKPAVRMEIICDDFLRIWWLNYGSPGAKNDINIYEQSDFFNKLRIGAWPTVLPEINIGDYSLKWFYFLCDGI
jgi:Plant transposon protein